MVFNCRWAAFQILLANADEGCFVIRKLMLWIIKYVFTNEISLVARMRDIENNIKSKGGIFLNRHINAKKEIVLEKLNK